MKPLGPEKRHYWLAMGMARTTRTDLAGAMDEGLLDSAGWAAMVARCRGCGWAGRCETWLEEHIETGAPCPPACVNRPRFRALGRQREDAGR